MRGGARAAHWVLAILLAAPAWAQQSPVARIIERDVLEIPATRANTAKLELTAVRFDAGGWERETLEAAFRQSAAILAQCGIGLTRVQLLLVDAAPKYQIYFTPVAREFVRSMKFSRPTVYFVRDTLNRPAFDAEAIGRANGRTRAELVNTVWIALGTRDLGVALAHELAHLLMDSGEHVVVAGNLMGAETAAENVALDAGQCTRMLRSGREGGLLQ